VTPLPLYQVLDCCSAAVLVICAVVEEAVVSQSLPSLRFWSTNRGRMVSAGQGSLDTARVSELYEYRQESRRCALDA